MKASDIRNMAKAEIDEMLVSLKEKLFAVNAEQVSGRLERPQRFGEIKRNIARCLTILKEKESES